MLLKYSFPLSGELTGWNTQKLLQHPYTFIHVTLYVLKNINIPIGHLQFFLHTLDNVSYTKVTCIKWPWNVQKNIHDLLMLQHNRDKPFTIHVSFCKIAAVIPMNAFYSRNNYQRLKMMVMAIITVMTTIYIYTWWWWWWWWWWWGHMITQHFLFSFSLSMSLISHTSISMGRLNPPVSSLRSLWDTVE